MLPVISLFSGTGGLDLAAEHADDPPHVMPDRSKDRELLRTVVHLEWGDQEVDTLKANFDTPSLKVDIMQTSTDEVLETAGLRPGDATLLIGGPPCTPFSKSGFWLDYKREGRDPNASLLEDYARMVAESKPEAFVMENVQGLTYKTHRTQFNRFLGMLSEAGYNPTWKLLNAADFGVPQLRKRVFVVGRRDGKRFRFPEPTHSGWSEHSREIDRSKLPYVTAGDAIRDLLSGTPEPEEIVNGTYGHLAGRVPPGQNYLYFSDRGPEETVFKWRSRYWTFLLRLDPDRPASTLQAQPGPWVGPFHWENVQNDQDESRARRLRVPEMLRLMTFPDDYKLIGSRRDIQRQLGNAVPVEFGKVVIRSLLEQLGHIEPSSSPTTIAVAQLSPN